MPESFPPPAGGVKIVACGCSHSVAVLEDGTIASWGRGEDGQLGHGDAGERHTPSQILSLAGQKVSLACCGSEHTLAFTDEGEAFSWGWGDFGRLGHGGSGDVFLPERIKALSGVRVAYVAAGDMHSVIITAGGEVLTFGRNQNGQLGLGSKEDSFIPRPVEGLRGLAPARMAGCGAEHTVVSLADGSVYSWGWNSYGNLGVGDCVDRNAPTKVLVPGAEAGAGSRRIAKVACGWRHSVAIDGEGDILTFGWSRYGQLGHGDNEDHWVPKVIESLRGAKVNLIAGGWRHTAVALDDGRLFCFGWNRFGQVGDGRTADVNAPTRVQALAGDPVIHLACGWRHTMATTSGGRTYAWGRGVNGQLGSGLAGDVSVPAPIALLEGDAVARLADAPEPARGYLAPADRYAVVPEGPVDDQDVPQFQPEVKRSRT